MAVIINNLLLISILYLCSLWLSLDNYEINENLYNIDMQILLAITIAANLIGYSLEKGIWMMPFNVLWGNIGYKFIMSGGETIKTRIATFNKIRTIEEKINTVSIWEKRDKIKIPEMEKDNLVSDSLNFDDLFIKYKEIKHRIIMEEEAKALALEKAKELSVVKKTTVEYIGEVVNNIGGYVYNNTGTVILCSVLALGVGAGIYFGIQYTGISIKEAFNSHQEALKKSNDISKDLTNTQIDLNQKINILSNSVEKISDKIKLTDDSVTQTGNIIKQLHNYVDNKIEIVETNINTVNSAVQNLEKQSIIIAENMNMLTELMNKLSSIMQLDEESIINMIRMFNKLNNEEIGNLITLAQNVSLIEEIRKFPGKGRILGATASIVTKKWFDKEDKNNLNDDNDI